MEGTGRGVRKIHIYLYIYIQRKKRGGSEDEGEEGSKCNDGVGAVKEQEWRVAERIE